MAVDGWEKNLYKKYLAWKGRSSRLERFLNGIAGKPAANNFSRGNDSPGVFRVAAAQLEMKLFKDPLEYAREMHQFVCRGFNEGARLIVFPENNNLQLLGMLPGVEKIAKKNRESSGAWDASGTEITVAEVIHYVGPVMQNIVETTFSRLAALYGVHIMAGSFLFPDGSRVVNRSFLFDSRGEVAGTQDKVHLMPLEEEWGISRGRELKVFSTSLGPLAFPVCMDATYFETFRLLELKGARVIMIPVANPEAYNYWLALRGIWPRVQESLVYGVKSAMVGSLLGFTLTGKAGIFSPVELTPEGDGVLAELKSPDREGMAVADLDLYALEELREHHPRRDFNPSLYARYLPSLYGCW